MAGHQLGGDGASTFGDLLRRNRAMAALSQEELAERSGLSLRAISDLERGARRRPYPQTVRALADALGLDAAARESFVAAAADPAPAQPPAASPAGGERPSFPVPPTPLIGRAREQAEVADLLRRAEGRLVTVTGPGGVGKTRLALAVADEVSSAFPDGVVFVDLSPHRDPALVLPAIAQALDVREPGGRTSLEGVSAYLHH